MNIFMYIHRVTFQREMPKTKLATSKKITFNIIYNITDEIILSSKHTQQ